MIPVSMTKEQIKAVNQCTEWLINVYNRQGKWLSDEDLWTAYPFKKTGMQKTGFMFVLDETKEAVIRITENQKS